MTAAATKQRLREELLAARLLLDPGQRAERSRAACDRLVTLEPFRRASTISMYAAMGAEADPAAAARAAASAGKRLAWPRLEPASRLLSFRACKPEDLVHGERGTRQPPADAPLVALEELDCVVLPGVGFDATGHRLGRGGGYYDATLAALPARAIRLALGFELQIVEAIPGEPHDVLVHAVVTEARVLWARPAAP